MTSEEGPHSARSDFVYIQLPFNFRRACGVIVKTTFSHIPTNKLGSLPAFSEGCVKPAQEKGFARRRHKHAARRAILPPEGEFPWQLSRFSVENEESFSGRIWRTMMMMTTHSVCTLGYLHLGYYNSSVRIVGNRDDWYDPRFVSRCEQDKYK